MLSQEIGSEELLKKPQVAELVKMGQRSVDRKSKSGLMPAGMRIGNSVRWSKSQLLRWISGGCQPIAENDR